MKGEDCSAEHEVYPTMFSASNQTSCKSHEENRETDSAVRGSQSVKGSQQRQLMFKASERRENLLTTVIHTEI